MVTAESDVIQTNNGSRAATVDYLPASSILQSPVRLLPGEHIISKPRYVHIYKPRIPIDPYSSLVEIDHEPDHNKLRLGRNGLIYASLSAEKTTDESLHLFEHEFGRDPILMSLDLIDQEPAIALSTIIHQSEFQGTQNRLEIDFHDGLETKRLLIEEEDGKNMHEHIHPDNPKFWQMARNQGWYMKPYYGSIDSTAQYIQLIDAFDFRYGSKFMEIPYKARNGEWRTISQAKDKAVRWILSKQDLNPEGFVEYKHRDDREIENPFWRDSLESMHHAGGRLVDRRFGVASFSVQIDTYKALQAGRRMSDNPEEIGDLTNRIDNLKQNILNNFWVEDERGGYFAIGTERQEDGSLKKLEIRTSDMGHILDSDILEGDDPEIVRKREMLIKTIFSDEMMNVSGVRTLSKREVRFDPGGYHVGSVWMRENAIVARGLKRHGYYGLALDLHSRNIAIWRTTGIFPEKVSGGDYPIPVLEKWIVKVRSEIEKRDYNKQQPGQEIQGWSLTAVLVALQEIKAARLGRLPFHAEDNRERLLENHLLDPRKEQILYQAEKPIIELLAA